MFANGDPAENSNSSSVWKFVRPTRYYRLIIEHVTIWHVGWYDKIGVYSQRISERYSFWHQHSHANARDFAFYSNEIWIFVHIRSSVTS